MAATKPFPFLSLPLELRESIYSLYFKPADRLHTSPALEAQGLFGGVYKFDFDLLRASKQVYAEAKRVWTRENVFVKVATPWPSAGMYRVYLMGEMMGWDEGGDLQHVSHEGLVPIVCTTPEADSFESHTADISITAPFHQAIPEHATVLLLDDVHLFAQTWYYSALSYPMLNDRLAADFTLRDPSGENQHTPVSTSVQRRLLLPFSKVKGLYHMEVQGYAPAIHDELQAALKEPIPTLQESLESATTLLERGDKILDSDAAAALSLYRRAFLAIHILIHGRTRRVLAGAFFHAALLEGRYAGQSGMTVRIILRLKLVARYVAAYLQLGDYGEAAFWGMRSVSILRDTMDTEFEHFLSELVGGADVGLIYARTGIALDRLERAMTREDTHTTLPATQDTPAPPTKTPAFDAQKWAAEFLVYRADGETPDRLFDMAAKYLKGRDNEAMRKELRAYGVESRFVALFGDRDDEAGSEGANADEGVYQEW